MKFLIITFLIALANAELQEIDPRLVSNVLAIVGEFPSAVAIRSIGTPMQPLCGGTVLDRQHILTSAQCVLNAQNQLINPFWYNVIGGDLNIIRATSRRVERRVDRIFVHPNYNAVTRNK